MFSFIEEVTGTIVKDAAGISAVVAVFVFAKSIYEHSLQNRLKRFEQYQDIAGQIMPKHALPQLGQSCVSIQP
jgi:hypothetical protein